MQAKLALLMTYPAACHNDGFIWQICYNFRRYVFPSKQPSSLMRYQDFELEISRNGTESDYIAKVRSLHGEAQQPFSLPDVVTLENLILKMRKFSRSSRAANCPEVQAASRFGELLFSNAFGGEISNLLKSCLDQTSNDNGLRIKLILQDAPELSALPWEFLYLPTKRDFLAHSPATPIVRYLKHAEAIKPLVVTLPLKLLVVIASPTDKARLDTEAELQTLEQALADLVTDGTLQITWLEHATVAKLAQTLEDDGFHLLHFIGHSYFDDKLSEGALILENAAGKSHYYDASRLKVLLHDHHTLRLVVLNSCEGAMSDEKDPFSSIATTLMLAGIPAVIAMQFEISDAAAISFATVFYKWLAKGTAIDEAVGKARKHLFAVEGNNVEWGTPVLHLRAKDGLLFDIASKAEQEKLRQERQKQEKIAQQQREQARLEQEKIVQAKIAQETAIQEKLAREESERQQKLQQEKLAQERAERLKKWQKYLTNALFAVVAALVIYAVFYGVSVAYHDYTEHQAIVEKQKADEAKAKAEQDAVFAKQQEAERLKQAAAAKIKAQKDADAKAKAEQKAAEATAANQHNAEERLAKIEQAKTMLKANDKKKWANAFSLLDELQLSDAEMNAETMFLLGDRLAKLDPKNQENLNDACHLFKMSGDAGNKEGKKYANSEVCKKLL